MMPTSRPFRSTWTRAMRAVPLLLLPLVAGAAVVDGDGTEAAPPPTATVVRTIHEGRLEALRSRVAADKGHPLLVNFWATWCVPCLQEIPLLNEIQGRFEERGLRLLAVSLDPFVYPDLPEAREKVTRLISDRSFHLPIFIYEGDQDSLEEVYSLPGGLPHTILLDPDGKILDRVEGKLEPPEVERLTRKIEAILAPAGR